MRLADLLRKYAKADEENSAMRMSVCDESTDEQTAAEFNSLSPNEVTEALEEREAIMEFEGGLPRKQAQKEAKRLVMNELSCSDANFDADTKSIGT